MHQLSSEVKANEKDIRQLNAQISALEMIASQYESMAAEAPPSATSSLQTQMLQILLDDCFSSFVEKVDFSSYATITRTLLTWVEQIAAHNDQFKVNVSRYEDGWAHGYSPVYTALTFAQAIVHKFCASCH
ncbi:hypothetical protein TELCIR_06623 [Teladorsagia circumcincta]|uniref:Uncharacterized protein n=1 Tax=Teladorsagia circumcincta TaxID=45464 RepID=A0A2G9UMG6_TELCI|nr:hypothetical protein TELCIR_06623 [Teladorsagia circumcincta]